MTCWYYSSLPFSTVSIKNYPTGGTKISSRLSDSVQRYWIGHSHPGNLLSCLFSWEKCAKLVLGIKCEGINITKEYVCVCVCVCVCMYIYIYIPVYSSLVHDLPHFSGISTLKLSRADFYCYMTVFSELQIRIHGFTTTNVLKGATWLSILNRDCL